MDIFEKLAKKMEPILALENFLKVKAPDRIERDAMYYNEKGEGFLDTFYQTNPEPVRYKEGDNLYYINDRGERFNVVKREDYILTNQKRLAATEEDFQEIYTREFEAKDLTDNPEMHNFLKEELIEQIKALISLHKEKVEPGKRDGRTLVIANKFLEFLNTAKPNEPLRQEEQLLKYDPKLFTEYGFGFFEYLFDVYIEPIEKHGAKKRFMNVWKYFTYHVETELRLMGSKEDYVNYIKENLNITIKNLDPQSNYHKTMSFLDQKFHEYAKSVSQKG